MVDIAVVVNVEYIRPFAALHKQRVAADALKSADWGVDAAGDNAQRFGEKPGGIGMSLHSFSIPIEGVFGSESKALFSGRGSGSLQPARLLSN